MHTPPPVWLIYVRAWREFRKFHYDPHCSQCSRPDWGHSPIQSLSPVCMRARPTHTHTEGETVMIYWYCQSLSMTKISTLKHTEMGDSKGDFFTVPNQSGVKVPEIKPKQAKTVSSPAQKINYLKRITEILWHFWISLWLSTQVMLVGMWDNTSVLFTVPRERQPSINIYYPQNHQATKAITPTLTALNVTRSLQNENYLLLHW